MPLKVAQSQNPSLQFKIHNTPRKVDTGARREDGLHINTLRVNTIETEVITKLKERRYPLDFQMNVNKLSLSSSLDKVGLVVGWLI